MDAFRQVQALSLATSDGTQRLVHNGNQAALLRFRPRRCAANAMIRTTAHGTIQSSHGSGYCHTRKSRLAPPRHVCAQARAIILDPAIFGLRDLAGYCPGAGGSSTCRRVGGGGWSASESWISKRQDDVLDQFPKLLRASEGGLQA